MARKNKAEFAEPDINEITEESVEQTTFKTHFPSTIGNEKDEDNNYAPIPQGYQGYKLKDLDDGETFDGKPFMTSIREFVFNENGKEVPKYSCRLVIIDDDDECYCDINLNLKSGNNIQKNIHKNSVLYGFISSIMDLEQEGWSEQYKGGINQANLEEYINFINDLSYIEIQVKEVVLDGLNPFNSFKVTKAEL